MYLCKVTLTFHLVWRWIDKQTHFGISSEDDDGLECTRVYHSRYLHGEKKKGGVLPFKTTQFSSELGDWLMEEWVSYPDGSTSLSTPSTSEGLNQHQKTKQINIKSSFSWPYLQTSISSPSLPQPHPSRSPSSQSQNLFHKTIKSKKTKNHTHFPSTSQSSPSIVRWLWSLSINRSIAWFISIYLSIHQLLLYFIFFQHASNLDACLSDVL